MDASTKNSQSPHLNFDKSVELMFADSVNAISDAKKQMWDVVKWGTTLQVTLAAASAFLASSQLVLFAVIPVLIGICSIVLVISHQHWLHRARLKLVRIRSLMHRVVDDVYPNPRQSASAKVEFRTVYCIMIGLVSVVTSGIVFAILSFSTPKLGN